ncbi:helix-turn-helix domain-containing protein [Corynebacterium sp. 3HC-13]|uniref:IclR family transcriptional regulator n=1 Tax=Corynebacterium poyangense TaxID=2684405 RepID=UPI001CCFC9C7|nr:IclR family transcriptional regulator [Corynebacterium poyangense]MBZ8177156.1 helix-turn-helix domain-containing protein [Corynebacterium poyangense]
MGQYSVSANSGIKVLDRAVSIMTAVAAQPRSLAELCEATDLPRATAHRLATALEVHRLLSRTNDGRWSVGPALSSLSVGGKDQLIDAATPVMAGLMDLTQESVQLYQLTGTTRTCIAAQEPPVGLQNTVPVGSRMALTAGSAAKIFLAYSAPGLAEAILPQARFTAEDLEEVRRQGWSESVSEREVGLASLSAPVFNSNGLFIAVLSISGPADRLKPHPGRKWRKELVAAAEKLSESL